ncbi:MAG: hypothetical protein IKK00_03610 [Oscillospiraceae bacterium]|nr:hypothetical protein [Oscillospiraceae bacterium]
MVKLILGLKGSGKTKLLVDLVKKALDEENGDVVCLEQKKDLTYDIPYQARLIHASDYAFTTNEFFKGFISGLHAGNYDITHIFIDNFFKIIDASDMNQAEEMLQWLDAFSERSSIKFTISATADPESVSEGIRKYQI